MQMVKLLQSKMQKPVSKTIYQVLKRRIEDPNPRYTNPIDADVRGNFRFDGLIPGTYEVVVQVFMKAPPAQQPRMPQARETVVVINGVVADVTITLQMPKPAQ